MYTTKPLSTVKATQLATQKMPQEGPNSGYLILQQTDPDQETNTCCFGICCGPRIRDLPFPQNKILTVKFSRQEGDHRNYYHERVLFVPVLNLPLAANRYYVVVAKGRRKGEVHTCSKEEDMMTCCFCRCINDTKPQPLDYTNNYQQIEIVPHKGKFTAKAVASDGFAPWIFRQKYWTLHEKTSKNCLINEALGLNKTLRSHLPEIEIPVSRNVGKWYCPFFFVKEKMALKEQMEQSMFYEVTLEQFWDKVYRGVENRRILFEGKEAMQQEGLTEGFVWFKTRGELNGERIGLSVALWERVKWEENRGGWIDENGGMDLEVKFGSFVLVERFLIKRMDGSLVLALDFVHTNRVITK